MWWDRTVAWCACSGISGRTLRLVPVLAGAAFLGCGASRSRPAPAPCEPVPGATLSTGVSPGSLAGRYRLILVATSGADSGASVEGDLTLAPIAQEGRYPATAVLVGTANIALQAVGAPDVGDPASTDPMRPGVLVFHRTAGASASIMLRLGAESNRQDQQAFEGAYAVLEVAAVGSGSFSGRWRSGVTETRAQGYFCAVRIQAKG